jgi:hypothetical protein
MVVVLDLLSLLLARTLALVWHLIGRFVDFQVFGVGLEGAVFMVELVVVVAGCSGCDFIFGSKCFEGFFGWDVDAGYDLMNDDFSVFHEVGVSEFDLVVDGFSEEHGVGVQKLGEHLLLAMRYTILNINSHRRYTLRNTYHTCISR